MKRLFQFSYLFALLFILLNSAAADTDLKNVLSKFDTTFYGRVKVDLNYDTAEFTKYNDWLGAVKAGEDNENDSVNFNPRDTRLGFAVKQDAEVWLSEARIETDFYGSNSGHNVLPRIRLAYVKATHQPSRTSILVGQDWIPTMALNPPTIDFGVMAASGNLWWRVPQLTVRKKVGEGFELLATLLKHRRVDTDEENRMPWLLGRLAYEADGSLVAVDAGWRTDSYSVDGADDERVTRWLGAMEFKYIFGRFTFMAEPWVGEGIDDEFLRYDLGLNQSSGVPEEIFAWGTFVSLGVNVSDKSDVNFGYGIDNPDDGDMQGIAFNDRQFLSNQYSFVNYWYKLTESIKVGAEIIYIRTDRGEAEDDGMRFTTSTIMSF